MYFLRKLIYYKMNECVWNCHVCRRDKMLSVSVSQLDANRLQDYFHENLRRFWLNILLTLCIRRRMSVCGRYRLKLNISECLTWWVKFFCFIIVEMRQLTHFKPVLYRVTGANLSPGNATFPLPCKWSYLCCVAVIPTYALKLWFSAGSVWLRSKRC